jgi:hypothetical protein
MPCVTDIIDSDGNPVVLSPDVTRPQKSTVPQQFIKAFNKLHTESQNYDVNAAGVHPPISADNVEKYLGWKMPKSLGGFLNGFGKVMFITYNFGEGARGLRNQLPLARIMTEAFVGNNVYGSRSMPIIVAAEAAKTAWNVKFHKGHQQAFEQWLKANKISGINKVLNLDTSRTEFSILVNRQLQAGKFLPEQGLQPNEVAINKSINDAIRNYQQFDGMFSRYVEESGIVDFSKVKQRTEWQPIRSYNSGKIMSLEAQYGREVLELIFGEAFRKNFKAKNPPTDPNFYRRIGGIIYKNLKDGISLKAKKQGILRFDGINKYEPVDMDNPNFQTIAQEINKITQASTTGDTKYLKTRVDLDDNVEIKFTNTVDGVNHDVTLKFSDLLSEDLQTNITGMINHIVGRAEIANRFDFEGFEIKNERDWSILMGAIDYQANQMATDSKYAGIDISAEHKKAIDALDYFKKRITSQWERNDVPENVAIGLKRLALLTRFHMLGATAAWQVLESTKIAALWGVQQAVIATPDLFRHVNDVRAGRVSKQQAERELIELTGLGEDTWIAHATALIDDMVVSHTGELAGQAGIDRALHRSNEILVKYISPTLPLTDVYSRLNITMFTRSFSDVLGKIKKLRDKNATDEEIQAIVRKHFEKVHLDMTRLSNFGMASYQKVTNRKKLMPDFGRFMDIVLEMERHATKRTASWGGVVDKFNMDNWNPRIRRDFTDLVVAHTWFTVLRPEVADIPRELDSNVGAALTTILRHGLSSHSRNFLHNVHSLAKNRDSYPILAIAFEAAAAWALIEMLNTVKAQAQKDSESYMEKLRPMLSVDIMSRMSNLGMTASWYTVIGMMLGYKLSYANTYQDILFSPPILGEVDNILQALGSIISILEGDPVSSKNINDITNATLGNNVFGLAVRGALNNTIVD